MGSIKHINSEMKGIGRCYYCEREFGVHIHGVSTATKKTIDHIIPLSQGGNNTPMNKVDSCHHCNSLKSDMLPQDFLWHLKDCINKKRPQRPSTVKFPEYILENMIKNTQALIFQIEPYKQHLYKGYQMNTSFTQESPFHRRKPLK